MIGKNLESHFRGLDSFCVEKRGNPSFAQTAHTNANISWFYILGDGIGNLMEGWLIVGDCTPDFLYKCK